MIVSNLAPAASGTEAAISRRKRIGLALLAPPAVVVAVFAVAEGIGVESGWWGHVLQLALFALLAAGAWRYPRIGGPLLIVIGVALAGFVAVQSRGNPLCREPACSSCAGGAEVQEWGPFAGCRGTSGPPLLPLNGGCCLGRR